MNGNELRRAFLKYFEGKGHRIVPSSPLVPANDPTLLFTNAGMNQFKGVFLGEEKRPYSRATTAQKCLRAGGKHNDLETVGRTTRHHTFFEMMGNFSFGDYFKEEAIPMAWEFLTGVLRLDPDRLWITIFQDDDEAFEIWRNRIGIPAEKIVRCGEKDNFWAMGETGPCGPCSELHIDQGPEVGCGKPDCGVECDCDRFMELWNLVFMQFNRDADGNLTPLPRPSIDTGLGLERVAAILEGVGSNFETSLILPIIKHIEELSGESYGAAKETDFSIKVIADHARAAAFLLADGVLPSNEGRGYVLRRIIRRASRHARMLGVKDPILYKTTGTVVDIMGGAYPELVRSRDLIARITLGEEERFSKTLDFGLKMLEEIIAGVKMGRGKVIPGEEAFTLYDTYGFPLDLTQEIAADHGIEVEIEGFEAALEKQRARARASWKGAAVEIPAVYAAALKRAGKSRFAGYETDRCEARVEALISKGELLEEAGEGDRVEIVLDATPFYGEAGGQVGDVGRILSEAASVEIEDTRKPIEELIVHHGTVKRGKLRVGDMVTAQIDLPRRRATVLNHSATHLLHAALKEVLGDHVKQAGSLVAPDRLRFDFSHFSLTSKRELNLIEELVNRKIRENIPVMKTTMSREEALKQGAVALFGEKYGDEVRVVSIPGFSSELCGGTHADATGEIGLFKMIREGSAAAGIRRIEALTGEGAYKYVKESEEILHRIQALIKAKPGEELNRIEAVIERARELEKEIQRLKDRLISREAKGSPDQEEVREVRGVKVLTRFIEGADPRALRRYIDNAKARLKSGIVVAGTVADGKAMLAVGVTGDLTERFHAGKISSEIAVIVDGKGGGRADMAQAGGKDPSRIREALQRAFTIVEDYPE